MGCRAFVLLARKVSVVVVFHLWQGFVGRYFLLVGEHRLCHSLRAPCSRFLKLLLKHMSRRLFEVKHLVDGATKTAALQSTVSRSDHPIQALFPPAQLNVPRPRKTRILLRCSLIHSSPHVASTPPPPSSSVSTDIYHPLGPGLDPHPMADFPQREVETGFPSTAALYCRSAISGWP